MNIQDFLFRIDNSEQAQLVEATHHLIESLIPQVQCSIKWNVPYYIYYKSLCYINPKKEGSIELCFLQGNFFSNEQGILDQKERKRVKGITLQTLEEIYQDAVTEILLEAATINEELRQSPTFSKKRTK